MSITEKEEIRLLREENASLKEENESLKEENASLKREIQLVKLRRQVTPHFLFNSISVAVSLVAQSPKTAMKFLRHLAQMYRYLLNYGNEYHVPIEQELEMLMQYYELMSLRHVNCLTLEVSSKAKHLKGHPLPPLALQGLLENAIKHNVHTEEKPLHVVIDVEDGMLVVRNRREPLISDSDSTHTGLAYMNETMKLLFSRELEIVKTEEMFTVKIPLL